MADGNFKSTNGSLCASTIRDSIRPRISRHINKLEVLREIDSTNDYLLRLPLSALHARIVLSECQTAGKGRRGRAWASPHGNIFMSIGWIFDEKSAPVEALSAVVGVCTCLALSRIGVTAHGIKWPNDIQVDGAKLAGILVETRSRRKETGAVIGVGINVNLDENRANGIDQPWTDLARQPTIRSVDRNRIAAGLIEQIFGALELGSGRFPDFLDEHWEKWDLLTGKGVYVQQQDTVCEGKARGITKNGALQVQLSSADEVRTFLSGEVSVRRA